VQYYPIVAFIFGSFITQVIRNRTLFYSILAVMILCAYINIWWVYHCYKGQVPAIGHSKHFYYAKMGRWTMDENDLKLMDNRYLFKGQGTNAQVIDSNLLLSLYDVESLPLKVDKTIEYTPEIHILNQGLFKKWTRIHADIQIPEKEWNKNLQHNLVYKFYKDGQMVRYGLLKPQRFLNESERKMLNVDCKTPSEWDKIAVFFWNPGSQKEILVHSIVVETFDE
ncbi:MAG TPA: hypothetical protein PKD85_15315, partial [Saprospiraceae bacterium]|nr:hypothetical protein [Saprospiraceae bacterium]